MIYALAHAFKCPYKLYRAENRMICCRWHFIDYSAKVFACRSCYGKVLLINGVNKTHISSAFSFLECAEMHMVHVLFGVSSPRRYLWIYYTLQPPFFCSRRHKTFENQKCRCSARLEVWQRCPCQACSKDVSQEEIIWDAKIKSRMQCSGCMKLEREI